MIPFKSFTFKDPNWRPKVLINHIDVSEVGLRLLRGKKCDLTICDSFDRNDILSKVKGMDGIMWEPIGKLDAEVLDAAGPQLKSISTISAGIDCVDLEEIRRRKIPLGYTPSIMNDAVADLAVGLAIAAGRRLRESRMKIDASACELKAQWMLGQELRDSTVGIVGFGGIGEAVAERLSGFKVKQFLYCGHNKKPAAEKIGATFVPFMELVERSDFVFISCPLTEETTNMFNAEVFDKMKPKSVLINIARGSIVDQDALFDALRDGKIFAAGLDVTTPEPLPANHPLLTLPNCVVTPHSGTLTARTLSEMAQLAAMNVLMGLGDQPMPTPVP